MEGFYMQKRKKKEWTVSDKVIFLQGMKEVYEVDCLVSADQAGLQDYIPEGG